MDVYGYMTYTKIYNYLYINILTILYIFFVYINIFSSEKRRYLLQTSVKCLSVFNLHM